jgi:hypothetical protein
MRGLVLNMLLGMLVVSSALAATEPQKQNAIDRGLAWLAATQVQAGSEGYWTYVNDGTLATTASAALAFIEEGYLPGNDVEILGTNYGDVVGRAVTYIFNRATIDPRFGVEFAGYVRYAEDYNNDGNFANDGGNGTAIYFEAGPSSRRVYTTGICVPVVYALGEALGKDTVILVGSGAINGLTYAQALQDLVDWFSWGQVEPDRGVFRGGWRYDANYSSSDNSTAQWGSLPLLYAQAWGLHFPQYVRDELDLWVTYIQNPNGGSGYDTPSTYVNVSKTGGLLMQFAVIGDPISSARVQAALGFIDSRWNTSINGTWYGNFDHAYAMWAVYKGLEIYSMTGSVESDGTDVLIGHGMPSALGGFTIGQDTDPLTSLAGDWYSHYCEHLCLNQAADGSWAGADYWTGPLASSWYINILNAAGAPPPANRVAVDYHPRACPNPLLTFDQMGYARAAILGTADFDVTTLDPTTLAMNGVPAVNWKYEPIAGVVEESLLEGCACIEVPNDEYLDLVFQVPIQELVATLGPVQHNQLVPATVGAATFEGQSFQGSDCWRIVEDRADPVLTEALLSVATSPDASAQAVSFQLPQTSPVTLRVFDVSGRRVADLIDATLSEGSHVATWDASAYPSGVYFVRLETGVASLTQKIVLVR